MALRRGLGPYDWGRPTGWRLFSKGLSPAEARERVTLEGDQALGTGVLGTRAVGA